MDKNEIGARGEDAASAYLERQGMTIVDRNWRCKAGEIDIVALEGESLVLIEVKTRKSERRGTPEEAVSPTKQKRIVRCAKAYLQQSGVEACPVRFDVIAIRVLGDEKALLRHHKAAFEVQ